MRDGMQVGDGVLFYHSSCPEPGIAGIARVTSSTRRLRSSTRLSFDPKSPADAPCWLLLDVQALRKTRLISLAELWSHPALAGMRVLQKAAACPSRRWRRLSGPASPMLMPGDWTSWHGAGGLPPRGYKLRSADTCPCRCKHGLVCRTQQIKGGGAVAG